MNDREIHELADDVAMVLWEQHIAPWSKWLMRGVAGVVIIGLPWFVWVTTSMIQTNIFLSSPDRFMQRDAAQMREDYITRDQQIIERLEQKHDRIEDSLVRIENLIRGRVDNP